MRTLLGVAIGITIYILWHVLGWPWIGSLFHDQPATPDDWAPRHRTWKHGIETT